MRQEVKKRGREVVLTIRQSLAEKVGKDRFELWFGSVDTRLDSDGLHVMVPDRFVLERLRAHFHRDLKSTVRSVTGQDIKVLYHLAAVQDSEEKDKETFPKANSDSERANAGPLSQTETSSEHRTGRQLASFESFIVGEGNRVAWTAARSTVERPGSITPIFLYGPTGSGKTHLAEAIYSSLRGLRRLKRCVRLSAEQFTSYFLEALQGKGLPSFRRKYRDAELLVLEDVHFFLGKRATLVEVQYTIDTLLHNGRQLILTSDRPPSAFNSMESELVARMSGGLVCGLDSPDFDTRAGILRNHQRNLQVQIPTEVIEMMAGSMDVDARQLIGALNRLVAASQAYRVEVSLEFAETTLADLLQVSQRAVRIQDIDRAVCSVFGLQEKSLHSKRKAKTVSQPRMLAMWLARKHTRAAFSEIGDYFGRRKHSTVISANNKVTDWVEVGQTIELGHGLCQVKEALRRVESQLRIG